MPVRYCWACGLPLIDGYCGACGKDPAFCVCKDEVKPELKVKFVAVFRGLTREAKEKLQAMTPADRAEFLWALVQERHAS